MSTTTSRPRRWRPTRTPPPHCASSTPGCHLTWTLLAGIGTVESDNGQYGGAVVLANGDTSPHILGPVLNGTGGVGAIRDTDGGRYDGNARGTARSARCSSSRAPGRRTAPTATVTASATPTTSTTRRWPPAATCAPVAATCGSLAQTRAAIMRYNHSTAYVDLVLRLATAYAHGAGTVVPNGTGSD